VKFAIITEVTGEDGKPKKVVPQSCVGADLADEIISELRSKVRFVATRTEVERAVRTVFAEQEQKVRNATFGLGPEHA